MTQIAHDRRLERLSDEQTRDRRNNDSNGNRHQNGDYGECDAGCESDPEEADVENSIDRGGVGRADGASVL